MIKLATQNGQRLPSFYAVEGNIVGPHGQRCPWKSVPDLICATASQAIQLRQAKRIEIAERFEADARALLIAFEEARAWRSRQQAARRIVARKGSDWSAK